MNTKKILSSVLVLILLFINIIPVSAYNAAANEKLKRYSLQLTGTSNGVNQAASIKTSVKGSLQVTIGGEITMSGNLITGTKTLPVQLKGNFYPFVEGYYKDKMLVGEFTSINHELIIKNVRLDQKTDKKRMNLVSSQYEGKTLLTLEIMDNATQITYYLQSEVSQPIYNEIMEQSKILYKRFMEKGSKEDYNKKIISLDLGETSKKLLNEQNEIVVKGGGSVTPYEEIPLAATGSIESLATKSRLSNFTYSQLDTFIRAMKSSNTNGVSISTYSIAESFFTTTGWDNYTYSGGRPYYASNKYTHDNGNGVYYTRLTMLDVTMDNEYVSSVSYFDAYLSLMIKHGIMIEYVQGTGKARLYLDDYGLEIYNMQMSIGKLAGNYDNIFSQRNITGQVKQDNYDVSGLIGLVDELSYLVALWGVYTIDETDQFNAGPIDFGSTVSEQLARYDKVVRAISLDSNNTYIGDEGNRMRLEGTIRWKSTWSYDWGYSYSTRTF
ncbi:MAG: hypothetical protein K0S47_2017 [Herbinix sp.]|jgi:hypothetical protein|nr:hypothetical protein [Herbinix sp.]